MKFWRDREDKDSILLISREVRDVGRKHSSSEKETIPGKISSIINLGREVRVWRPHSDMGFSDSHTFIELLYFKSKVNQKIFVPAYPNLL